MKQNRGFTLIELVTIIALLGIMVVFYIESAGNLSDVAVDAASRKVQSDIRYAQLLAQTNNTNYGAKFNLGAGYEVYRGAPGTYATDPVTLKDMTDDLSKFPGVSIQTNNQIEFNAKGYPVMGADSRVRLQSSSGAIRDVYVVDKTGAVVVDLIQYGTGCSCQLEERL